MYIVNRSASARLAPPPAPSNAPLLAPRLAPPVHPEKVQAETITVAQAVECGLISKDYLEWQSGGSGHPAASGA